MKKHSAYWMKFSSIMAFSLQSYPQPLLIFFCSKQKSFMKCTFITSFSISVAFSHIIYLPIETTTFEMLFSPVPFQREVLNREWKKRKDYFRQNALPILKYNDKSLLRLLYQCKCTPANFLLKLVCHSVLICFSNKFIYMASFLYMKCIGELAVGDCISLKYVCSYIKSIRKAYAPVLFTAYMESGSY